MPIARASSGKSLGSVPNGSSISALSASRAKLAQPGAGEVQQHGRLVAGVRQPGAVGRREQAAEIAGRVGAPQLVPQGIHEAISR